MNVLFFKATAEEVWHAIPIPVLQYMHTNIHVGTAPWVGLGNGFPDDVVVFKFSRRGGDVLSCTIAGRLGTTRGHQRLAP